MVGRRLAKTELLLRGLCLGQTFGEARKAINPSPHYVWLGQRVRRPSQFFPQR